jgi:hypothetical protein
MSTLLLTNPACVTIYKQFLANNIPFTLSSSTDPSITESYMSQIEINKGKLACGLPLDNLDHKETLPEGKPVDMEKDAINSHKELVPIGQYKISDMERECLASHLLPIESKCNLCNVSHMPFLINEPKCNLCNDSNLVKIKCIICDGNKKQIECIRCVKGIGYNFAKRCIEKCFKHDKPAMQYYFCDSLVASCTVCHEDGIPCAHCDATGENCYMCHGVGVVTQICPKCIILGKIQTIKD